MNEAYARAIASWHYDSAHAFYDMDQDQEDLAELLDPQSWINKYHAMLDGDHLVGFFCFEREENAVLIGLGLRPDCTGKGLGQAFLEAGLQVARERYHPTEFRLVVATFNQRAIRLYEKAGFERDGTYLNQTNGGQYEFLRMTKKI